MRGIGIVLFGLMIGFGLAQGPAWAQQPILKVCSHLGFEPFVIYGKGDKVSGIDVDIVRQALMRTGYQADYSYLPWARLLRSLQTGECDIGFSLFDREQRRADMHYFYEVPIHFSTFQVFTLSDRRFAYQNVEDLYGMKVAFNRGFAMSHELETALSSNHVEKFEYDSVKSAFNMLFVGRVDAIIDNSVRIKYFLRTMAMKDQVRVLDIPFFPHRPAFLVFSRHSKFPDLDAVQQAIGSQLIRMDKAGEIDGITDRYTR